MEKKGEKTLLVTCFVAGCLANEGKGQAVCLPTTIVGIWINIAVILQQPVLCLPQPYL